MPEITDAPFYIFLAFAAPFAIVGAVSGHLNKKSRRTRTVEVADPNSGEVLESKEVLENPDLEGIKFSKNDWLYAVISFLKTPLILVAVLGGMFAIMFAVVLIISQLTQR